MAIMARATWIRHGAGDASSVRGRRERLSIDLRGHGPALDVIAQSMQISVAVLVRTVLADWLKVRAVPTAGHDAVDVVPSQATKFS